MTLTDFLLARIAEDEHRAGWYHQSLCLSNYHGEEGDEEHPCRCRHPDRLLAECEAKRRIVDDYRKQEASCSDGDMGWLLQGLEMAMEALAVPYAAHPDYQQEWAV
jgi:hypothetical protein